MIYINDITSCQQIISFGNNNISIIAYKYGKHIAIIIDNNITKNKYIIITPVSFELVVNNTYIFERNYIIKALQICKSIKQKYICVYKYNNNNKLEHPHYSNNFVNNFFNKAYNNESIDYNVLFEITEDAYNTSSFNAQIHNNYIN